MRGEIICYVVLQRCVWEGVLMEVDVLLLTTVLASLAFQEKTVLKV